MVKQTNITRYSVKDLRKHYKELNLAGKAENHAFSKFSHVQNENKRGYVDSNGQFSEVHLVSENMFV